MMTNFQTSTSSAFIVAGPCSAESLEQVMTVALSVKQSGACMFRAGLWKPRTSPNSFAGVGAEGLPWLQQVQKEIQIPVATEVATAEHVSLCLESGIRAFWIGARTTTNPFLVQQVADAISKSGTEEEVTVMVKNPINPDLATWVGAIERFKAAGVKNIIAVHRGFSDSLTVPTDRQMRNDPLWSVPLALHRCYPEIPVLCDPSHLGGDRALITQLSKQALQLGMTGLMIEVHPQPGSALSDSGQQITPKEFESLVGSLCMPSIDDADTTALQALRSEIDRIDNSLGNLLLERLKVAHEIGTLKRESGISVYQEQRFNQILENRCKWARENGLDEELVKRITEAIHELAIREQL